MLWSSPGPYLLGAESQQARWETRELVAVRTSRRNYEIAIAAALVLLSAVGPLMR